MAAESIVSQLTTAVTHLQASRYASAAASTIYVYDIVLTFGKEVRASINLMFDGSIA